MNIGYHMIHGSFGLNLLEDMVFGLFHVSKRIFFVFQHACCFFIATCFKKDTVAPSPWPSAPATGWFQEVRNSNAESPASWHRVLDDLTRHR